MRWDGKVYADIVKESIYAVLFSTEIPQAITMGNKEYTDFLKSHHEELNLWYPDKHQPDVKSNKSGIKIIFKDRYLNNTGDNSIELTWSMAARHIRAWEYEKAYDDSKAEIATKHMLNAVQEQWEKTHLCGNKHDDTLCEHFLQTNSDDTVINGKRLDKCCYYCTSEDKIRKIGGGGSWTGLSPKFCPKRKALEQKPIKDEKESKTMARKLQLDAAITRDMKSAASDSFIDNIKMIEVDEILENGDNFYSISDIELLADDIEREGLMHNLAVSKNSNGLGYILKSGHRRLAAIKLLIKEKRYTSTKIPCYVCGEKTEAETQFDLIMLNATQRKYSDADVMREYEEIERTFKVLEAEGKPLKGRIRDNIAAVLKVSPAQVGKIENIKHNAVPEVEKAVKSGAMSISTANEVAKLSEEKQREIADKSPDISHKEVKKLQENEKPPVQKIIKPLEEIEDDTDEFEDDLDELDELFEDDNELDEKPEVTSEKKSCSKTITLTLSEADASALLDFLNDWADDNDNETVMDVWNKLKAFCG